MTPTPPNLPDFFAACLEQDEAGAHPWDPLKLHSSDLGVAIGELCPRQLWLRLRGAPRAADSNGKRLMFRKAGEIHKLLAGWMQEKLGESTDGDWIVVEVEELVENEGTGRLDVLISHRDGTRVVVDFKSMRGAAFRYLDGAKPSHVIQVQDYIRAKGAVYGLIVYTDREGQNGQRQYVVERNDTAVVAGWEVLKAVQASEKPAPKIPPKKGKTGKPDELPWQCEYCPYLGGACTGALVPDGPLDWKPEPEVRP